MKTKIRIHEVWKHNYLDNEYLITDIRLLEYETAARLVKVISKDVVYNFVLLEEYILQFYHKLKFKLKLAGEKTNENKPK